MMKVMYMVSLMSVLVACGRDANVTVNCPVGNTCIAVEANVNTPQNNPVVEPVETKEIAGVSSKSIGPVEPEVDQSVSVPTSVSPTENHLLQQETRMLDYIAALRQTVGTPTENKGLGVLMSFYSHPTGADSLSRFAPVFEGYSVDPTTINYWTDVTNSGEEFHQRELHCGDVVAVVSHVTDITKLNFQERLKLEQFVTVVYDQDAEMFITVGVMVRWTTLDGAAHESESQLACEQYPTNSARR